MTSPRFRRPIIASLLAATLVVAGSGSRLAGEGETPETPPVHLFDGKSLEGWSAVSVGEGEALGDVWKVEDGVIVCKGEPLGYLVTDRAFTNFKLELEWRWAAEPTNSGVLLRIAGDPIGFMPRCVEAQLKHGSAGDLWAFRGAGIDGAAERVKWVKDHEDLGDFKGIARMRGAEKPAGEWNRYEIHVEDGTIRLKINGQLVNEAKGLEVLEGPIGLQSEGSEIHFRKIILTPL